MCRTSVNSFQLLKPGCHPIATGLALHLRIACARVLGAKAVALQEQHHLDQGDFNPMERYVRRLEVKLFAPQWTDVAFKPQL